MSALASRDFFIWYPLLKGTLVLVLIGLSSLWAEYVLLISYTRFIGILFEFIKGVGVCGEKVPFGDKKVLA